MGQKKTHYVRNIKYLLIDENEFLYLFKCPAHTDSDAKFVPGEILQPLSMYTSL